MSDRVPQEVLRLYEMYAGQPAVRVEALPASGSYRRYFRMEASQGRTLLAAVNADVRENEAFLYMTRHFEQLQLPVPHVCAVSADRTCYLLQDLGDTILLSALQQAGFNGGETPVAAALYRRVLDMLLRFQTEGARGFDFSYCYPRPAFDTRAMMWDLNYFKYHFLKLLRVPFDEERLENDFERLCAWLLQAGTNFFMYRDFQSRNVMITPDGELYGIDYQGGRGGALPYDVASLLYESKTALSPAFRASLLQYYLGRMTERGLSADEFCRYYDGFVFIRLMQAMGAYGFRGLYEQKPLFVQSIPPALRTLQWLLDHVHLQIQLPELERVWHFLAGMDSHLWQTGHKIC